MLTYEPKHKNGKMNIKEIEMWVEKKEGGGGEISRTQMPRAFWAAPIKGLHS